ncbi:MAG: riboflavin biosynthesis protein RibF [Eggerthellaceae bacterium]|nr:riboflavin biosynthesis protein RibF [Eggerthellaceae bacterium]
MAQIYSADEAIALGLIHGSACSFGVFDGVHEGHRFIIDFARKAAEEAGGKSIVITFSIDPDEMFRADSLKKLMSNEDRIAELAKLDVDAIVVLPFSREFAAQPPHEFLEATFGGNVPSSLHVGYDFRFGCKASGNVSILSDWGSERGMKVFGHELLVKDGAPVTSTRIRGLLGEGKIEEACELLGHPYAVYGAVEAGRGEGRDMGFKTANIHVPDMMKVLGDGVYAAYATVDGKRYKAAVSVGVAPSFEEARANTEAHILDFDGDIYGSVIKLEFTNWLRPMMKFPSLEVLIETVMGNIDWVRRNL